MMSTLLEEIYSELNGQLYSTCPVLSGNMKDHVNIISIEEKEVVICIEAPFYDMKHWEKTKEIKHTGAVILGRTDYAEWVNRTGAFGTHNKSEHWVNRACYDVVSAIASGWDAEVDNKLPL